MEIVVLSRPCLFCRFARFALAWLVAGHPVSKGLVEDCSEAEGCPSFRRLSSDGWLHSFQAGRTGIPGTEIVQLVSHKGSLFASVGYWMHPSHHPGRILRLDCPTCEWEMEHPEEGNVYMSYVVRLECLKSVRWTTQSGTDELLHATGYLDWLGEAHCVFCTRNDATKLWACNPFYKSTPFTENGFTGRSMIHYEDPHHRVGANHPSDRKGWRDSGPLRSEQPCPRVVRLSYRVWHRNSSTAATRSS